MSRVIRHIIPVSQPRGSNLCWAAVTAMILGRSGPGILQQIVAEARAAHVAINSNDSLDTLSGVSGLASAFNLRSMAVSEVLAGETVAGCLGRSPCGFFGLLTVPPASSSTPRHAVACHGIVGDLSASSTCTVLGVDPRGYSAINMTFFQLQQELTISHILYKA